MAIVFNLIVSLIAALPQNLAINAIALVFKAIGLFIPNYRRLSFKNLKIAFPDYNDQQINKIIDGSPASLGRLVYDFARLDKLDKAFVEKNVEFPFFDKFKQLKASSPGKGILIATGHLGSFELLAHTIAVLGFPVSFVVRSFKWKALDQWWRKRRERLGNRVISRKGAFSHILEDLRSGRDVAILFDQNVRASHAVFVPWFGIPAATTKALALSAIKTKALVLVAGVVYIGAGKYRILVEQFCIDDIYDSDCSLEEKVFRITSQLSKSYENMVKAHPEQWFWMHRRYRTQQSKKTSGN